MANPALLTVSGPVKSEFRAVITAESSITALAALEDKLFLACRNDIVRLNTVTQKQDLLRGHRRAVQCLEISSHNGVKILISGSKDKTVRAWNVQDGTCIHTFYGHKDSLVTLHKSGDLLFSGGKDGTVRVWAYETGECTHFFKCDSPPAALGYYAVNRMLYVRTQAAALVAYKLLDKGNVEKTQLFQASVQAMTLGASNLICAWEDNTIRMYNLEAGSSSRVLVGHRGLVESLRYENDALVSCARGEIRVWNTQTGQCRMTIVGDQCGAADLLAVGESNNGTAVIAVASDRQTVSSHSIREVMRSNKLANAIAACNTQGLSDVDLERCDLMAFPDYEFEKPTNVNIMRLTGNKLNTLPPAIKEFKKLKELYMSENQFSRMPTELCSMRYLRRLYLESNMISTLPTAIGRLVLLEELSLASNNLSVLPPSVGDLVNLTYLNLSGNQLLTVPQTFVQLRKVETLLLNNNLFGESLELAEAAASPKNNRTYGGDTSDAGSNPSTPRTTISSPAAVYSTPIPAAAYSLNTGTLPMSPLRVSPPGKKGRNKRNPEVTTTDTEDSGYRSDRTTDRSPRRAPPRVSSLANDPSPSNSPSTKINAGSMTSRDDTIRNSSSRSEIDMTEQTFLNALDFSKLPALVTLHLHHNRLARFPKYLIEATALQELNMSNNHIKRFPQGVAKLKNLQRLFLSRNFLTSIPDEVEQLVKLEELHLDDNRLRELPEKFEFLHSLKKLVLSKNNMSSLPLEFGRLNELRELSMDQNALKEFPAELTNLQSLKLLSLDRNKLVTVPTEIYFMTALQSLSIRYNQLKRLPYQSLIHLTKLSLDGNIFTELPSSVTRMRNLTDLSLTRNQLNQITPDVAFCSNLTKLDLSSNNLAEIPPTLALLPRIRTLNLSNNIALRDPPRNLVESVNTSAIVNHLLENVFGGAKPAYEARICFVGLEGSGKSALLQRLRTGKFQKRARATKGVEIDEMVSKVSVRVEGKKRSVKAHFALWDFSGNEDYLPLQTMCMSERTLFFVVWDLGLDESRSRIDFWLSTIRVHSGNAPVIIVGTHADSVKDTDSIVQSLEKKYLNSKYPNVKYVVPVSCFSGGGIEKLMKRVSNIMQETPYMGEQVPGSFTKLMGAVVKERAKMKVPLVELSEFQKLALSCGVDKLTFSAALHYLHDIGLVLNMSTMTFDNQGAVILDPSWMFKLMSSILGARKQFIENGYMHHDSLNKIWSDSEISQLYHLPFIAMMHRLELAFEEGGQGKKASRNFYSQMSIFPSFLPETASKSEVWPRETEQPEFVKLYKLGFIPSSLIGRLMCRVFRKTRPLIFWRDGFIVADVSEFDPTIPAEERKTDLLAKVETTAKTATLKLTVRGSKPLTFMRLLTDTVDHLVKRWYSCPRMQVSSYVSYTNLDDPEDMNAYIFPLQHIENQLKKGQMSISYNNLTVPLKNLLPDVEARANLEDGSDDD